MQDLVAPVDHIKFDLEVAMEQQLGVRPLPFPGMDKSGSAVCEFFMRGTCHKGQMCPFRHICGEKTVVCEQWLRGLCKKGDQCEFLHEFDLTRMPERRLCSNCQQSNKEWSASHRDPGSQMEDSPWCDRGFTCGQQHTRRATCADDRDAACPEGDSCEFIHPQIKFLLEASDRPPYRQLDPDDQLQSRSPPEGLDL